MKSRYKMLMAGAVGLAGLAPAQAVVVNSGFGAAAALNLASSFSSVVRIYIDTGSGTSVCTGSLISATTVLTAKHCTSGFNSSAFKVDFDQNGNGVLEGATDLKMSVSGKFEAPSPGANANLVDGTDLAMLTLIGPPPVWASAYPLWVGGGLGSQVTMVGYGGQGVNTLTANTAGGSRWGAENIVDKVGAAGFNQAFSANIISTDFDNGSGAANTLGGSPINSSAVPLFAEGTTAGGDSGGPLFFNFQNTWVVGGVLSGGTRSDSSFGDISWWTGVGDFRDAIEGQGGVFLTAVPELPSYAMALLGLCAVAAARRRRQARC